MRLLTLLVGLVITTVPAVAWAQADIELRLPGNVVVASGDTHDLGAYETGVPRMVVVTIANTGDADLVLTAAPAISGQVDCTASVGAAGMSTIAAGATTTATVTITVDAGATSFQLALTVTSDDPDGESTYVITMNGTAHPPDPEIAVQGPGGAIADLGTDDVGDRPAGVAFDRVYTVANLGNGVLSLTGTPRVAVSAATNTACVVATPPATPVAAMASTTFTVAVTPTAEGAFSCGLHLASNDASENPYDVTLSGTVVAAGAVPTLEISGATNLIGSGLDLSATATYSLGNTGAASLQISDVSLGGDADDFSLSGLPGLPITVAPGEVATFSLSYTPSDSLAHTATIDVESNTGGIAGTVTTRQVRGSLSDETPAPADDGICSATRSSPRGALPILLAVLLLAFRRRRRY